MGSFAKLQRFSEFRPSESIFEDPRAWWRYAINAVLLQIRIDRKKHLSLRQISVRHRDKLVYTELWKSKLISSAAVVNQLSQAIEDNIKPVLDRDSSAIYQATYNRAKLHLAAAQQKEGAQKGPVLTSKGLKQSKFTASLNNAKIPTGEEKTEKSPEGRPLPAAPHALPRPIQPLNKDSIELLRTLEYMLSFEDIVLFRSLAEKNLSLETTTQSWLGGLMSWVSTGGQTVTVSEEEKRKLFEALKYDPDRVLRGGLKEVNQNEVMAVVSLYMQKASVTLALTSPDVASSFGSSIPFLKLELDQMRNRSVIMGDGAHVSVSLSLQDFSAYEIIPSTSALGMMRNEGAMNKILFRRILRGGGGTYGGSTHEGDWAQSSANSKYAYMDSSTNSVGRSSSRRKSEEMRPLFSTVIEILPPNKDTDVVVSLNVEELEIWVNPTAKWTSAMATFVAWPEDQQYWSEMEMGAMNQLADFKARFDAKIDYMMQNHQNIAIEAHIKAPVVVVSDVKSQSDSGDVLVIDLGLITLSTEKLAKAQRQKLIDARSHTGFTSDATCTTPTHHRPGTVDRFRGQRDDVAQHLNFSERKLPAVQEQEGKARQTPPGWEMLTEAQQGEGERGGAESNGADADGEDPPRDHIGTPTTLQLLSPSKLQQGSLRKADLEILEASFEEEKSRAGTSEGDTSNYMTGAYGGLPAPSIGASTVHTGGMEFGQDDETLFDVFQCQISQIEVYLINAAVLDDQVAAELDNSKIVIVDKFEIGIAIHVSVLPWDITIPPVKLIVEIPEINVKLSEQKILRLKQFATELITDDSQAILSSNLARINNLNTMMNPRKHSDAPMYAKSSRLSSKMSLLSNGSSMLNIRSKSRRTMSLGEASSMNDLNFYDTITGRNSMQNSNRNSMVFSRRNSQQRSEVRRSRSRAGSASFKDVLENEQVPVEERLKKLVDMSYVVGSEDGDAMTANYRDPEDTKEAGEGMEEGNVDDDDDDSFFSVFENMNIEEHAKKKEELQFVISQRESIRAKLMSDIRTSEADPSKAALHDTLKRELVLCEQELQQLRVAFVELLMSSEDLDLYSTEDDPAALQRFHDGLLLPSYNIESGEKFAGHHKRDLAQASVFKVPPTRAKQAHKDNNNRELVYLRTMVHVVNVDLECTSDSKLINAIVGASAEKPKRSSKTHRKSSEPNPDAAPLLPVITCRLSLYEISMKLRHRSQDSRLGFSMQGLDVEDIVQMPVVGLSTETKTARNRAASVFLLSSDASNFGLFAVPLVSRYNSRGSTDLLKVKYEVLYGADTLDEHGNDLDQDGDGGQDTHNIKLAMGMIGVNVEQSRIALLILTTHRILQNAGILPQQQHQESQYSDMPSIPPLPSDSPRSPAEKKRPEVAVVNNNPTSGKSLLPNVLFWAKIDCVCISLLAKNDPLLTVHLWALSTSVQSRCQSASVSVRLADFSASYMKRQGALQQSSSFGFGKASSNQSGAEGNRAEPVEKIILFGRDPASMLPFLSSAVHYEKDSDQMIPPQVIVSVKTVPVLVNVDLDAVYEVMKEILQGPIMEIVTVLTPSQDSFQHTQQNAPVTSNKPIGSVLDGAINPLVDMCNGRVEIVTGSVTVICSDSRTPQLPAVPRDDLSAHKNDVSATVRTVEVNIMWGDVCEFGAVQATVAVLGVKLSCSDFALNDPIDSFCKICVLPNAYFTSPNQSDTVANLSFSTDFPPPEQGEINSNECQVALSVSPVHLHVHESLLRAVQQWVEYVVPAVEDIQALLATEAPAADPTIVQLLPVPVFKRAASGGQQGMEDSKAEFSGGGDHARYVAQRKAAALTDFNVTLCMLVYEVVVSLEVAASSPASTGAGNASLLQVPLPFVSASKARPVRKHHKTAAASAGAGAESHEGTGENQATPHVPIFRLVLRKLGSEVVIKAGANEESGIPTSNGYLSDTAATALIAATFGIDSVDFEHIKFSGVTYKRLLSSGNFAEHCPPSNSHSQQHFPATPTSTSSALLDEDLFDVSHVDYDDAEHLTFRFLTADLSLFEDSNAKVDVHVDNVHVTMIADAALALMALTDIYVGALNDAQLTGMKRKGMSHSNIFDSSARAGTKGRAYSGSGGEEGNYNNYYFAHPSSVPMAPTAGAHDVAATPLSAPTPLPITLLNSGSFSLSDVLRAVAFNATMTSCFLYLPSERRNGAGPSICAAVSMEVAAHTHDISTEHWNIMLQNLPKAHIGKDRGHSRSSADLPSEEEKSGQQEHLPIADSAAGPSTCSQVFASARCTIHSMEVFLLKTLPAEICNPVASLQVGVKPTESADNCNPAPAKMSRFAATSPVRSSSVSSFAPDTPMSTHTSNTSLGGASHAKDSQARYHSKSLVFPFGAEILYSAFVETRSQAPQSPLEHGATNTSVPSSSNIIGGSRREAELRCVQFVDNLELHLSQRVSMEVHSDLEVQCFLDVRPFVRMYETSIKPIADAIAVKCAEESAQANIKSTGSRQQGGRRSSDRSAKASDDKDKSSKKTMTFKPDTSTSLVHLKEGQRLLQLTSLGDVLGALGDLASLHATARLPNLIVYVINDIYRQPVSIARLNGTGIEVTIEICKPVRDCKTLLLADVITVGRPYEASSVSFAEQTTDMTPSRGLSRGVSFFTSKNPLLSPDSVRSVGTAFMNKITGTLSNSQGAAAANRTKTEHVSAHSTAAWIIVTSKATVGVEYYNQRLIVREPLIEPFPLNVHFTMPQSTSMEHGPLLLMVNSRKYTEAPVVSTSEDGNLFAQFLTRHVGAEAEARSSEEIAASKAAVERFLPATAPMNVILNIPEAITVNLTMALTEILLVTAQTVSTVAQQDHGHHSHSHLGSSTTDPHHAADSDISILGIRNDSGLLLRYWTREDSAAEEVPPNTEAPLQVEYSYDMRRGTFAGDSGMDGRYTTARFINISLHDAEHNTWPEIHDVPLEGVGTRLFNIDFKQQRTQSPEALKTPQFGRKAAVAGGVTSAGQDFAHAPSLALELVSKGGNKMLIVRSTIRIFNSTKATFKVELVSGYRSVRREVLWEALVPPNQGIPVPANLCNIPNGRFVVKPVLTLFGRNSEGTFWPVMGLQDSASLLTGEVPVPQVPGLRSNGNGDHGGASHAGGSRMRSAHSQEDLTDDAKADGNSGDDEAAEKLESNNLPSNSVNWRRKLIQQRGTANVQTYSHWLSLSAADASETPRLTQSAAEEPKDLCSALTTIASSVNCNVHVSSKGVPRQTQTQVRSTDSCMLRTLTFTAPITVVNLTAGGIIVAITPDLTKIGHPNSLESLFKADRSFCQLVPQTALSPGESWDFLSAHAFSDISLSLKFCNSDSASMTNAMSSISDVWSEALLITGCRSRSSDTTTYSVEVPYLNGSRLSVQVEVVDRSGTRVVNVFVPYWLVTNSFLPLQYQHETWFATAADRAANGSDGLAADQSFTIIAHSNGTGAHGKSTGAPNAGGKNFLGKRKVPHSGLGRARGLDGVVLGPELPSRGLVDVLCPAPGLSNLVSRHSARASLSAQNQSTELQGPSALHNALGRYARSPSISEDMMTLTGSNYSSNAVMPRAAPGRGAITHNQKSSVIAPGKFGGKDGGAYSIMQCSYSYKEKRTARMRLRTGTTSQWSSYFSLDNPGTSTLEVASAPQDPAAEDADIARVMPHMVNARKGAGDRIFSLGMSIAPAEPPFNRTQVVVMVDRYVMMNTIGHPIEVRQVAQDSVFTLRNEDEVPLWWRGGSQHLQMRLARYGWSWSGKFPVNKEGEFSIRLRNDFDNTVFFVLVHVLMKGPFMYVIFRGGEKFSPYRFENHTLDTFKIKQKGQIPCTVLLPYHSSAYAWDEPLMPHFVSIEVLKNALQSQDDWGLIGTFSFDALGPLDVKPQKKKGASQYLTLRVVAQGPTRVLQIFDRRILRNAEKIAPVISPATSLVSRLSATRGQFPAYYATTNTASSVVGGEVKRAPMVVQITVNISSVGVSLVDHIPQELIYVSVSGIHVVHSVFPQEEITMLDVQRMQVDNQLWSTPYPSLLYPLMAEQKFVSLELHRDFRYAGMEFIPLLKLFVAPFDVNLDGTMIVRMLEAASYVIELLDSSHTAMHSRTYSQRIITTSPPTVGPTTAAPSSSVGGALQQPEGRGGIVSGIAVRDAGRFTPVPPLAVAQFSAPVEAPPAPTLSYHDAVDFVAHSPYSYSPKGDRLRPSQVDHIHSILHTISAQQQLVKQQQKKLQFSVQENERKAGENALLSKFHQASSPLPLAGQNGRKKATVGHSRRKSSSGMNGKIRNGIKAAASASAAPESSRATLSHYFVHKMLDCMAAPTGSAIPSSKIYLQRMELSEIRLNASFNPVVANDTGSTTIGDISLLKSALNAVVMAIGSAFAKIENCPIRFRPYNLDHVFTSGSNLGMMFARNYGMQAVTQSYIVVFSSEVLGNPVRLIYTLGEGIWDFLYLPTMGLFESPSAFVGGAIQGTASLVRTVFASVFSTAGSLASSLQVGLITLGVVDRYPSNETRPALPMITDAPHDELPGGHRDSVDGLLEDESAEHSQESAGSIAVRSRLHAPHTIQQLRPQNLFRGLQMGMAGLVFDPITGFRADGVKGLVIGIAKGSAGFLARPLYGTLGFVSQKLDQISFRFQPRFLANQKLRLQRVRSPRFFRSPNQPLRVYSSDENMGQDLLSRIHQGEYRREGYLWHAILKDKSVILMTKMRVMIISNGFEFGEILWNCPTGKMRSLDVEYTAPSTAVDSAEDARKTAAALHRLGRTGANNMMNLTRDSSAATNRHGMHTMVHTPSAQQQSHLASLVNFDCTLEGEPVLHIYHEPLQNAQSPQTPSKSAQK